MGERYFEGHREGKRGRGAAGKLVIFAILKRGGRVCAIVPANLEHATLRPFIREPVYGEL